MIWIILELARNLLKACKQDGWHRLTNLVRMSRFHVVYYCLKAAQVIHWFPLVSHVFPVCGHELEVEGQAGSKRSFRIPAPRIFCHPHLLSILRFTPRNTSWQVSKLHWSSAALRSSILRGSYKSGEDVTTHPINESHVVQI